MAAGRVEQQGWGTEQNSRIQAAALTGGAAVGAQLDPKRYLYDVDDGPLGWLDGARCAETNPDAFSPGQGESPKDAKKVCKNCEVSSECLEYALAHNILTGVWGGMTAYERRPEQRKRKQLAA